MPPDAVAESSPLGRGYASTELWKRSLLRLLHVFARDVSGACPPGVVNPLPFADEATEGAFVCMDLNDELSAAWASYLSGKLLARLHAGKSGTPSSPPVQDYRRLKKDASATKARWDMEHDWAWDDVAKQYCVVYALSEGLKAYFGVEMSRAQCRAIFATADQGKTSGVDMHELKQALQHQLAPDGTLATLCDALIVPFTRTFLDERGTHRARLQHIGCVDDWTDEDWRRRLGPLPKSEHAARAAFIAQQEATIEAARKAAAVADGPRSRSGARPAKGADWSLLARGVESPAEAEAEAEAVPVAEAVAVAVAAAPAGAEAEAEAGSGDDGDAATLGIARTEQEDAAEAEAGEEVESAPSASDSLSASSKGPAPETAFEKKLAEVASPSPAKSPAAK